MCLMCVMCIVRMSEDEGYMRQSEPIWMAVAYVMLGEGLVIETQRIWNGWTEWCYKDGKEDNWLVAHIVEFFRLGTSSRGSTTAKQRQWRHFLNDNINMLKMCNISTLQTFHKVCNMVNCLRVLRAMEISSMCLWLGSETKDSKALVLWGSWMLGTWES